MSKRTQDVEGLAGRMVAAAEVELGHFAPADDEREAYDYCVECREPWEGEHDGDCATGLLLAGAAELRCLRSELEGAREDGRFDAEDEADALKFDISRFAEWLDAKCDAAMRDHGVGNLTNELCEVRERLREITACIPDPHSTLPERLEAAEAELERRDAALRNVSVHSAHNPGAPRELLVELLARCGEIARRALATGGGDAD